MIKVENVTKLYGHTKAIDNITFSVSRGQVLGFLGPNGAGKTTTMRMITGFMAPTQGRISIGDYDVVSQSMDARRQIGYLPETPPLYGELTIRSYLDFVARLKGIKNRKIRKERIQTVAESCWISDVLDKHCSKLSKGYRQRVGLAQALIHDPAVLILDEPTIGLDPKQIQETRELIKGLSGQHTVILSTHILPEVQMTCERVVIINKGRIIAEDTPEGLMARGTGARRVKLKVRGPGDNVEGLLRDYPDVSRVQLERSEGDIHTFAVDSSREYIQELLAREIIQKDWGLLELQSVAGSLEDTFIQLITDEQEVGE